jgi:hypothetical protein
MSRITQKPAVGTISPFIAPTTNTGNTNYTGTATPAVTYEAFSAIPATGAQPSTGTGFYDPNFCTYVGQKFETSDGREFVLVVNGGAALVAGKVVSTPAQITTALGLSMTVPTAYPATAGSTQILVTNGSTVLSVNQFQGGYLITQTGTGAGQHLKIASHQAAANGATFVVTLEDALQTTLDATTKVSLVYNPYGCMSASAAGGVSSGVIVAPTSVSGAPIGVSITPIAASTVPTYNTTTGALTANGIAQYGLIQTHGPVACLIDTTTTVGYPLGPSGNTAGALLVATETTVPQIAISMTTQVSTDYGMVFLQL